MSIVCNSQNFQLITLSIRYYLQNNRLAYEPFLVYSFLLDLGKILFPLLPSWEGPRVSSTSIVQF